MHRLHIAVAALGLGLLGCNEKKAEPVKATAEAKAEVKVDAGAAATPEGAVAPPERAAAECAAPIGPGATSEVKFGDRTATLSGTRLTFGDADTDGRLVLGVLGPINEDSGENLLALPKYLKAFVAEKADAIVVTGDVGENAAGIARVLKVLAGSKLPVLVTIGNRECRAEFTDGLALVQKEFSNVVNMTQVREVSFPELTLLSVPGYHNANYLDCKTACQYFASTVDEVVREAKTIKTPLALVSHGPPHGAGPQALDYAGGGNVGDEALNKAIAVAPFKFGFFSNIKEAGGRASKDAEGTQLVKEGESSATLYLNPGPADTTVGWDMNDGTKSVGLAAVFSLKEGQATWKSIRLKPLTAAEKAEAKALTPTKDTGSK